MARARALGARGRWFESSRPDKIKGTGREVYPLPAEVQSSRQDTTCLLRPTAFPLGPIEIQAQPLFFAVDEFLFQNRAARHSRAVSFWLIALGDSRLVLLSLPGKRATTLDVRDEGGRAGEVLHPTNTAYPQSHPEEWRRVLPGVTECQDRYYGWWEIGRSVVLLS